MNPKKIFVIISVALLIAILYLGLPIANSFYMAIFDPLGSVRSHDEFRKLSSDILIKRMDSTHPFSTTPLYAIETLAERRETKAVPDLIKMINSWNPDRRYQAIRALGLIGDERAVEPLSKIVNEREQSENKFYRSALLSLCQIGYEPMRPVVLERLKRPDGARNGAVTLIGYIGEKEDIQLLEEMYSRIHEKDDVVERIEKKSIRKAIDAIKQREGML